MALSTSLRSRLTLFVVASAVVVLVLTGLAATRLVAIDKSTEALGEKWLAGSHVLHELETQVVEFQIAEDHIALAADGRDAPLAARQAEEHRKKVIEYRGRYLDVMGADAADEPFREFDKAWNAYMSAHSAWLDEALPPQANGSRPFDPRLHDLFHRTMDAIHAIVAINEADAQRAAGAADWLVDETIGIMIAGGVAALVLSFWVMRLIRVQIIRPVESITQALTRLAGGNRDVEVPEVNRVDEIGEMAQALDVFRGNAVALEQAHEEIRIAQEKAQALARHDPLTGLVNRRVFSSDLEAALARCERSNRLCSVLLLDLDGFKAVNDLQGHPVGDTVLCEVADRLKRVVRRGDTVARLGGDEFAIVVENDQAAYPDAVMQLADRLIGTVHDPITTGEGQVEIGVSVGIATAPADGVAPDPLLRAADLAMYRAKAEGRGQYRFFEEGMDRDLRARAQLEADLRAAVANDKVEPHYQPLIDLDENKVYGFEILARWTHPGRGEVVPDVFIPLAEHLGLIPDLTWSLLRRACRDARQWPEDIRLSLNISPTQLKDTGLPMKILSILNQEGFSPSRLEIEVTESALVTDLPVARAVLAAFQDVGIKISLDDFGTGYSSLYHLRELKFDKVKIDRSFVQSLVADSENEKIVDAILSLAANLGLPTVAEGIESAEVIAHLNEMGCRYGQGYYYGKAMDAKNATAFLRDGEVVTSRRA